MDMYLTEVSQQINELISSEGSNDQKIIAGVESLAAVHGDEIFSRFFGLVVGKVFTAESSRKHWDSIVLLADKMVTAEFRGKGFFPALVHHFYHVERELESPRIHDALFFDNIMRSSVTDGLTGLYNQTYFKAQLSSAVTKARRNQDAFFSIILFDLDHFKKYNDTCGHLAGDRALKQVAAIIRGCLREYDIAARYGGEEFALLLPHADKTTAYKVAERIRRAVEAEKFDGQELLPSGNLTISGGLACAIMNNLDAEMLINIADAEMYKAKNRRNSIYPVEDDRRRCSRKNVKSLIEYATVEGSLFRPALSIDISEHGLAFGTEDLFSPGASISLRFTRPFWTASHQVTAKVRQCRREGELMYVGLEFDLSLDSLLHDLPGGIIASPRFVDHYAGGN